MDVDDATREGLDEEVGHQGQKSCQHDEIDMVVAKQGHHKVRIVELGLGGYCGLDAQVLSPDQSECIGFVANNEGTTDTLRVGEILDEVLTVGSTAGNEDGDVYLIHIFNHGLHEYHKLIFLSDEGRHSGRGRPRESKSIPRGAQGARQVATTRNQHIARDG